MNDEKKGDPHHVKYEDAVSFLSKVTPNAKCSACGGDSWLIAVEDSDSDAVEVLQALAGDGGGYIYMLANCATCGLMRNHHLPTVKAWIDLNLPSKESAADE